MWWGLLILPYLIGWTVGIWGPGSPRWMVWLGIPVGIWYLTIFTMAVGGGVRAGRSIWTGPLLVIATLVW